MKFSTQQAARKLGIHPTTLHRHLRAERIPEPPEVQVGGVTVRLWSERDIAKARKVLAGIKPGRKPKEK